MYNLLERMFLFSYFKAFDYMNSLFVSLSLLTSPIPKN